MSNWKPAATPLTSRTRSHVSRSSECLRKHFGFFNFERDFLANEMSDQKDIFRVSN